MPDTFSERLRAAANRASTSEPVDLGDIDTPQPPAQQDGFGQHNGQWELPGARAAVDKLEPMVQTDTPDDVKKARGKVLADALAKIRGQQGNVDNAARSAWGIPFYGRLMDKLGANKPAAPVYEPTAEEKQMTTMRQTIDNMKYAKEQEALQLQRAKLDELMKRN